MDWGSLTVKQKVLFGVIGFLGVFGILGGIIELLTGHPEGIISILFWPIVFGLTYFGIQRRNQDKKRATDAGWIDTVLVGNYLVGLPNVNRRVAAGSALFT